MAKICLIIDFLYLIFLLRFNYLKLIVCGVNSYNLDFVIFVGFTPTWIKPCL